MLTQTLVENAQFGAAIYPGYHQPLPSITYDLPQDLVDTGYVFGTGVDMIDAEMTTNQAVSHDTNNIIDHDLLFPQQAFPVVSSSPYSHNFPQPGALQSGFCTDSGLMSGSIDLHSELLAAGSLNQDFPKLQTPINNSFASLYSMFDSIDSQNLTSSGETFDNPTAMADYTWPVTGNHLLQPTSITCVPASTYSPIASFDPLLQQLGVNTTRDSHEFLNETSAARFCQSVPGNMSHQKDRKTPDMEIIKISDDDKGFPCYSSIGNENNNISRPRFGPSRPVSLLPARKGGRKGALSAQEKKQTREARKQGICIRCRKIKVKVSQE